MSLRISLCAQLFGFVLLVLVSARATPAQAQATGSISGTVANTSQQAIFGATVSAGKRTASTDANGHYTIAAVPIGNQTVAVSQIAYNSANTTVKVHSGTTVVAATVKLTVNTHLTITGVAVNTDSVKIRFYPVPGAADYRVYDSAHPTSVKYAGVWNLYAPYGYHFLLDSAGNPRIPDQIVPNAVAHDGTLVSTPTVIRIPALEIEMNGLTPGANYSLVVEAVNALGPVCQGSLYDANSVALYAKLCAMCQLGSNMGCTGDGNMTTNGQGGMNNRPGKIASVTVHVTPTGRPALPSTPEASQTLFDTFESGDFTSVGTVDDRAGTERFTLQTPAVAWDLRTENVDTLNSRMFVMGRHFMDILFDGGTPGSNNPLHQGHGVISLSPAQTVTFDGGKILHLTQEVDGHLGETARRWIDFRMTPANDPYLLFETTGRINTTDTDFMVQIFGSNITVDQSLGPKDPSNPNSAPIHTRIVGAAGQAVFTDSDRPGQTTGGGISSYWAVSQGYQQGRGLDNRSRLDVFVSQTHFAIYEDGIKITEHDLAQPLAFAAAKVYFSHYHYHSALEVQELGLYAPWESYWLNMFPYSDERHWDNMGYEVLPANTDWFALASLVQPPAFK